MLPEEYGGGGITDCVTGVVVQEELCRGCAGIGNLITSGGFFAEPIVELGSEEQKRGWLEPIAGERPPLTALATTEPGRLDAASIATTATRTATATSCAARRRGSRTEAPPSTTSSSPRSSRALRSRGITAVRRREGRPGVTFGEPMKMGQRAIVNTEMFLEDAELPEDRRLGDEGRASTGSCTFDRSRITLGASATGIARAALEYAVEYAKSREQFGKPIAEHQAVAFRLADMATRVDAARLLVHRAARRIDAGEHVPMEAAMAKLFASETAMWCTWAAVQTLGGWGYSRVPGEKWMRDAKLEEIEEGTSDIQRLIISRNLLK